jgi:micrococcal nuclease
MIVARHLVGIAMLLAFVAAAGAAHAQMTIGPAYVTRVVDADTLYAELGGRLETVRYLGINTPRIEHPLFGPGRYALLAREANRRLVEGKWVHLKFEGPTRDASGRLLGYVWSGNVFVNAALVHYGYGEAATGSTAGYAAYFRMLQEGAQREGRGLWRDRDALAYHRPRPTEVAADAGEDGSSAVSGGRVFSAPAPYIPAVSGGAPTGSIGVPGGPLSSGPASPSYIVPPGSMRTTR